VADNGKPLLIKRYASRRLYNTETSDYVTLDDISQFIRDGRNVQIIDLKSGADLTRQYLLQIIADHESRGENVLPTSVLNDLVRSYTNQATSVVPEFLAASFEMLRDGQSQVLTNMTKSNPMAQMPGMEAMRAQQEAFMKAMTGGMGGLGGMSARENREAQKPGAAGEAAATGGSDLDDIKAQLAELQRQLAKIGK